MTLDISFSCFWCTGHMFPRYAHVIREHVSSVILLSCHLWVFLWVEASPNMASKLLINRDYVLYEFWMGNWFTILAFIPPLSTLEVKALSLAWSDATCPFGERGDQQSTGDDVMWRHWHAAVLSQTNGGLCRSWKHLIETQPLVVLGRKLILGFSTIKAFNVSKLNHYKLMRPD